MKFRKEVCLRFEDKKEREEELKRAWDVLFFKEKEKR